MEETNEKIVAEDPWRSMDDEELKKQYSPSYWSKRMAADEVIAAHVKKVTTLSEEAKEKVPHTLGIPYGVRSRAKLDVFGVDLPKGSPVLMFVHGGYWQDLHKDISSYFMKNLYEAGVVGIVTGYTLASECKIEDIIAEIQAAIKWCEQFCFERDWRRVYLAGHSAGAMLITQAVSSEKNLVRGLINISGVFDLRPLVHTYVNEPLKLTEETAWAVSPIKWVPFLAKLHPNICLLNVVGENDSPEFKRQAQQFSKDCSTNGLKSQHCIIKSVDHFDIVERMSQKDFELFKMIINFINTS